MTHTLAYPFPLTLDGVAPDVLRLVVADDPRSYASVRATCRTLRNALLEPAIYKQQHIKRVVRPGGVEYLLFDKRHNEGDMWALEKADGTVAWYTNGRLNRDDDKPAVVWVDGTKEFYKNGRLYRVEWNVHPDYYRRGNLSIC